MKKTRKIGKKIGRKCVSVILCFTILISQLNIVDATGVDIQKSENVTTTSAATTAWKEASSTSREKEIQREEKSSKSDASTEEVTEKTTEQTTEESSEEAPEKKNSLKTLAGNSNKSLIHPQDDINLEEYYKDKKVCIYNYQQLLKIDSSDKVYTEDKNGNIGEGKEVEKSPLVPLKYAKNGDYLLMNDIEISTKNVDTIWNVSDTFKGTITGEEIPEGQTPTLYDKDTDTIYIYNPYQLDALTQDGSENRPVMSVDYQATEFGMGQMIYPDGEDQPYLTYSKEHKYVLTKYFNSDRPALLSENETDTGLGKETQGRDFKGQVVKTIGDKKYILIGNEEQLRKIGSGDTVYGPVYQAYLHAAKWYVDEDENGKPIMLYGGDADLKQDQNEKQDYTFGKDGIDAADKKLSRYHEHAYTWGRCGVDPSTGKINPTLDIDKAANLTYSANANYIIFRDIDLSSENWTPLMFQGTMMGAKKAGQSTIWKNNDEVDYSMATDFAKDIERPVISNITVNQDEKLEVTSYIGVGFFATISSEASTKNIGLSAGTTQVCNIELSNITVANTTSKVNANQTLISGLLSGVGGLLGGLVDVLVGVITIGQVKLDLRTILSDMLNARAKDPTALATGCFAGRVVGDVKISKCKVSKASVTSVNDRTGGFVGYMEGMTEYDGLSKVLGGVVDGLTKVLNIIPGLGLGDLITILLGNAIPLGDLIPTGYKNAIIEDCCITGLSGDLGQKDKGYVGGFIGQQTGSWIKNCKVEQSKYQIIAQKFGGGFVGLARDGEIKGTLTEGLNIDIKHFGLPASLLYESSIETSDYGVSGERYLGGFSGAQAYTEAINCKIDVGEHELKISGTDTDDKENKSTCVGGFCGTATIGWLSNLGSTEATKSSLLNVVTSLLTDLLSTNGTNIALLSLVGIAPSAIVGCQISSKGILVASTGDYAGGMVGKADAAYIGASSEENLGNLVFWKKGILTDKPEEKTCTVTNLESVSADNFAGGVAGSIGTASVAGLLNATVGVASFLGFTVDGVSVSGNVEGSVVNAKSNGSAGAFGEAIGGKIKDVTIENLKSVTADNIAGGFVGVTGTGSLASTGGLTINLLGLNKLLNVSNLLSVAQGVEVEVIDSSVTGVTNGLEVRATGSRSDGSVTEYCASGFAARAHSAKFSVCEAKNIKSVTAAEDGGFCGGFVGISKTGGLAEVGSETSVKSLIEANGLLSAVKYLIPSYTQCSVTYVDKGGVSADVAGGFAGDFQSGTVDNQKAGKDKYYAVYNLDHVNGQSYAGGFGGNVYSGALAEAGKGISILGNINGLNINIGELLNLINAYIPEIKYAGVKSKDGFSVTANAVKSDDSKSGSAGGFIGYGSGVQVSYCDVSNLKHTKVSTPKDLESVDAPSYFDQDKSTYAVTGARYAGGYIGFMDIGSAASIGKGLSVLGKGIVLNDVLSALNVVVSTIEHSNVTGNVGGFAVKASKTDTKSDATKDEVLGDAGGFAGKISGGHIQDSNSYNFSYVIGQITAGGYVGDLLPGNIANVLGDASILGGLVNVNDTLASVASDFVPTIRNSSTTCIPCGGAVRAQAVSSNSMQRGLAGGYAGHNEGGHIWGNNTKKWKSENDDKGNYNGPTSICSAVRIRSVYGQEIAGGFTGLMESADTASAGNLSLLWGLVKANNILGALSIVYPTEENTAVYGPLAKLDVDTWNSWAQHVGKYGGYGKNLAENGTVTTKEQLDQILEKYAYGYNVVAGRSQYQDETTLARGGAAGGYVGAMHTGTITNGQAHQAKAVKAIRCAGGFAGEMVNGGAANLGGVSILGLKLELGQMLNVLDVFVPVIKKSSVKGYQSGLSVKAMGIDDRKTCGYAGGYIGRLVGGQVWGSNEQKCEIKKLRRVDGTGYVGGFVGNSKPGSVASVNTTAGEDLLSKLLNSLISAPADMIKVLDATVSTIRYADVSSWNDWGIIVNGAYTDGTDNTSYATAAGGFAGSLSGTVLGKKGEADSGIEALGIRSVVAGEYAGGCFGIADVDAGVSVSADGETSVLGSLLKLGQIDVLDAFRTYVYYGSVKGSEDAGLSVHANQAVKYGQNDHVTYSGSAGGFGGTLSNSSIKNSKVENLSDVTGLNSVGGFVGYSGKSGVVDLNKLDVLGDNFGQLLGGALGVLDIFGSHIDDSSVSGIKGGYTVQSTGGEEEIAGGFIGYANLARMSGCMAGDESVQTHGLKQVASGETAGGFAGRTSFEYLADVKLDSTLVDALLSAVLNPLVKALYLDKLQDSNLLHINLGIIQIDALYQGNLLHVNLLGLDISVALSKKSTENPDQTDFAIITIGDSTIKLPCDSNGIQADDDTKSNIEISLIKANRTKITDSKVYGISDGYDVYAGGAGNQEDGTNAKGRSGGFVGYNDEGLLQDDEMYYCDVVRGTDGLVGPFSGKSKLDSVYQFNTLKNVEGEHNIYRIYRKEKKALDEIKKGDKILNSKYEEDTSSGWNIYSIAHMQEVESYETLKDADLADTAGDTAKLNAYESPAKAVLMADTKTTLNTGGSDTPEPSDTQDPCDEMIHLTVNKVWKDFDNTSQLRPDSIKITISRTWTDSNNQEQTQIVPGYESCEIKGSINHSTWKEVINELPAYQTEEDGTIHYYTYSVTEAEVDGYETTINTTDDGFTFHIINQHTPKLPDAGGYGRYFSYLIGTLLFLLYLAMRYKKSKEDQKAKQL